PARRLLVASTLIWDRVLGESRRTADRLRWWISMLLACLIATCIVAALTKPWVGPSAAGAGRVVIVVDTSPTMAARTTDGATRFEHARRQAQSLIDSAGPDAEFLVVDTMHQIATPAFESADEAGAQLMLLHLGHDRNPRIPEAVAVTPARSRFVITDGVLLRNIPADSTAVSVFEPVENVGITALELKPVPGDPRRVEALIEVTNAGGTPKDVDLVVTGVGAQRIARQVALQANSAAAQTLDVSAFEGGPLRAALTAPGDALAADDVAYDYVPMRRALRVTLVSAANAYLRKSLAAQPRIRLKAVPSNLYRDDGDADLYVFDRFAPGQQPSAPSLLLRPTPAAWLPATGQEIAEPQIASWDGAHPLLDNISLRDLYIADATPARRGPMSDGKVLVGARGGEPLMMAQDGERRWVWLAFDLDHSNFALHAGFPVFLSNAIDWLAGEAHAVRAQTGSVRMPLARARVVAMDGSELAVDSVDGAIRFDAPEPGLYTAVTPNSRIRIAVNVLDHAVTRLNDSRLPAWGAEPAAPQSGLLRLPVEPWSALLAIAACLLIFEWLSYNRRLTI
ncbi:MAG: hypothetical protein ACREUQ_07825, partial [Burkholderiales bacterium]